MLHPMLVEAFKRFWQKFTRQLKICRKKPSIKAVHDLRVSIRRLLAILAILEVFQPEKRITRCVQEFKQLMRPFGRLRDTQVQIQWIEKLFPRIGAGLNEYLKMLSKREERLRDKIYTLTLSFRPKICRKISAAIDSFPAEPTDYAQALNKVKELSRMFLKNQYQMLCQCENKIKDAKNIEALHQFRIIFKKYRYTVEVLGPLLFSVPIRQLDDLHQFQILLGEIHDFDVLGSNIARFKSKKKRTRYEITNLKSALRKLHQERQKHFESLLNKFKSAMAGFDPEKLICHTGHASNGNLNNAEETLV